MSEQHPSLLDSMRHTVESISQRAESVEHRIVQSFTHDDWHQLTARTQAAAGSPGAPGLPALELVQDTVRQHRDLFDPDHNGVITVDHLRAAAAHQGNDADTSATIVTLLQHHDELAANHHDENYFSNLWNAIRGEHPADTNLTMADLQSGNPLPAGFDSTFARVENSASQDHSLFGPNNEVTPDAVQQGQIGDCTLHATLTSMASTEQGREMIRQMIQREGDNYRVTFPGGQSVVVEPPTVAESGIYAGNTGNGTWPAVIERAYGRMIAQNDLFHRNINTPQLAADDCGGRNPFGTMTGGGTRQQRIEFGDMNDDELSDTLTNLTRNPIALTAQTANDPTRFERSNGPRAAVGKGDTSENLFNNHEYAVDGYNPETATVYLRNPHHGGRVLSMDLDEFRRSFTAMDALERSGQDR